jgi:hypothetical protein
MSSIAPLPNSALARLQAALKAASALFFASSVLS